MLDEWFSIRSELKKLEALEHPDITDILGRTWVWKSGDIYVHDSLAWPEALVRKDKMGWPIKDLLNNPNYTFCSVCITGMSAQPEG